MPGLQEIPLRIPSRWDPVWFERFVREVLALADARNAIAGAGVSIEGQPDTPALISSSADLEALADQSYVLTEPSSPPEAVANARVLTGETGVVEITDQGPGAAVIIGLRDSGVSNEKLRDATACSVLGRASASNGPMGDIAAAANDTVLRRTGDAVGFGALTLGMAPNGLWTYEKLQDVSGPGVVLGRASAGAGPMEELALSDVLDFVSGAADGDMLVRADGEWTRLPAGTDGQVLMMVDGVPTWVNPPWASAEATFLTVDDETTALPNSRQLVAGTDISFDTSTPGQLEISTP